MAATSNSPHSTDREDQFIGHVWAAFKPYVLMLRDAIMPNTQPSQESPDLVSASPSIPLKLPPIQARRAACTHLTMIRLNGTQECMICHRPSDLGWVYSCTQDDEQCPWCNFHLFLKLDETPKLNRSCSGCE